MDIVNYKRYLSADFVLLLDIFLMSENSYDWNELSRWILTTYIGQAGIQERCIKFYQTAQAVHRERCSMVWYAFCIIRPQTLTIQSLKTFCLLYFSPPLPEFASCSQIIFIKCIPSQKLSTIRSFNHSCSSCFYSLGTTHAHTQRNNNNNPVEFDVGKC